MSIIRMPWELTCLHFQPTCSWCASFWRASTVAATRGSTWRSAATSSARSCPVAADVAFASSARSVNATGRSATRNLTRNVATSWHRRGDSRTKGCWGQWIRRTAQRKEIRAATRQRLPSQPLRWFRMLRTTIRRRPRFYRPTTTAVTPHRKINTQRRASAASVSPPWRRGISSVVDASRRSSRVITNTRCTTTTWNGQGAADATRLVTRTSVSNPDISNRNARPYERVVDGQLRFWDSAISETRYYFSYECDMHYNMKQSHKYTWQCLLMPSCWGRPIVHSISRHSPSQANADHSDKAAQLMFRGIVSRYFLVFIIFFFFRYCEHSNLSIIHRVIFRVVLL